MQKLLNLGVLKTSVWPWVTRDVFVLKKVGGIRVTSDGRRLSDLPVTDSYPTEDRKDILNWLGSEGIYSVFDVKDRFFQVKLRSASRECKSIRPVLGLVQYKSLATKESEEFLWDTPTYCQHPIGTARELTFLGFLHDTSIGTITEKERVASFTAILV